MKKQLFKKMVSGVLLCGVIMGGFITNASAKNYTDKYWQVYECLGDMGWQHMSDSESKYRMKEDSSAAYIKMKDTDHKEPDDYMEVRVEDQYGNSLQGNLANQYVQSKNVGYSIHNMAYEKKGKSLVTLGFNAPHRFTYSWTAWGVWSPDSLKNYN